MSRENASFSVMYLTFRFFISCNKLQNNVVPFSFWYTVLWSLWCSWWNQDSQVPLGRTPDGVLMDCSVSLLVQIPEKAMKPLFNVQSMTCFNGGWWWNGILTDTRQHKCSSCNIYIDLGISIDFVLFHLVSASLLNSEMQWVQHSSIFFHVHW
jgi:hypothetical protein